MFESIFTSVGSAFIGTLIILTLAVSVIN